MCQTAIITANIAIVGVVVLRYRFLVVVDLIEEFAVLVRAEERRSDLWDDLKIKKSIFKINFKIQ